MADRLARYRTKRDFSKSPEPEGTGARPQDAATPRFVVQKHAARRLHFDLRLEHEGVLRSFAVTRGPSADPSVKRLAVETEDHPLAYGDFEGVIPEGYGAGSVMLWDRGTWAMVDGKDADEGFAVGALTFELSGSRLLGRWHLQRLKGEAGRPPQWLLIKVRDGEARATPELTEVFQTSVATGRTMEQIAADKDAVWHGDGDGKGRGRSASVGAVASAPTRKAQRGNDGGGAAPVPEFVPPALCKARPTPPRGAGWLAEVKYDGYRMLLRADEAGVRLLTRTGQDWSQRFPTVIAEADPLRRRWVLLDGEMVVFDAEGRTSFSALHGSGAGGRSAAQAPTYVAFDCLFLDGIDLRSEPIEARKGALSELLARFEPDRLRYGDHLSEGKQEALFERAGALGLEGIVVKRAGSPYRSGRHGNWVKVRAPHVAQVVVGAFTAGGHGPGTGGAEGQRNATNKGLGALVAGGFHGSRLVPLGRVGTGFSAEEASSLLERLEPLRVSRSPFAAPLEGRGHRFVRPELVVNVSYAGLTADGLMRHAAYASVAAHVSPRHVVLPPGHPLLGSDVGKERGGGAQPMKQAEGPRARNAGATPAPSMPGQATRDAGAVKTLVTGRSRSKGAEVVCGVTLTNPDKVLFPDRAVTKRALAEHYLRHMERLLPHIEGRPLTLLRCPEGQSGACFYQRHPDGLPAEMGRALEGEDGGVIVARTPAHVMALVQRGVLEIHLRGSRVDRPDRPDWLVFDLDPGEGVGFDAVRSAAFTVRDALGEEGLVSFVKTTGGKGLHVVAPIERRLSFRDAKAWCRDLCAMLAHSEPERFVTTMKKSARRGRIFLDYFRNDRKASAVAPYSSRAREGAPVAVPLAWEDLAAADALPRHLVGAALDLPDPWADLPRVRQRVKRLAR